LRNDVSLWFQLLELNFSVHGISSEQKRFQLTVTALPSNIIAEIRDLVFVPHPIHPYSTIKSRLISRLQELSATQLDRLLIQEDLGDRLPSQLLLQLRCLV